MWLRDRLPDNWEVGSTSRAEFRTPDGRVDAAIDLKGPSGTFTTMVIEVKQVFGPRDVDRLLGGVARTLRTLAGNTPILVVAPWLSQRTQELLGEQRLNYLDLTGNALIRLDNPTLYLQAQGAAKDPNPPQRSKARVQGPKAGRLIRLLVDVRPPYGVRDLATAADLAPGYVSRLLDTLDDEALAERSERGRVESGRHRVAWSAGGSRPTTCSARQGAAVSRPGRSRQRSRPASDGRVQSRRDRIVCRRTDRSGGRPGPACGLRRRCAVRSWTLSD